MAPNTALNESLFEICRAMVSAAETEEVLRTILDLTVENLDADAGSILLYEPDSENLKMLAAKGLPPGVMERGYIHRKGSVTERVLDTGAPLIMNETTVHEEGDQGLTTAIRIKSALCVPLIADGKAIGTLNLNRYHPDANFYSEHEVEEVTVLASQAAISIEVARLTEENVQQARLAAIGQTTAGISHCVKNILTGLRGAMGLIDMAVTAKDWGATKKGTVHLRNNVERISLLVLDMLDFSKEKKDPLRRDASASKLFNEVMMITEFKAEKKGVEVTREIEDDSNHLLLDPDQIFRCLLNLVENAIDACESGSKVILRATTVTDEEAREIFGEETDIEALGRISRLTVEDTGEGIAPENLRNIFDVFFSTKKSKGTGLGLAVTQKIAEEHGGLALVESELGKGTAFHLIIPEEKPA